MEMKDHIKACILTFRNGNYETLNCLEHKL